jgi:hypothetical protein
MRAVQDKLDKGYQMASVLTSVSAGVKDTVMGANMKGKDEGIPTSILDTKVRDSVTGCGCQNFSLSFGDTKKCGSDVKPFIGITQIMYTTNDYRVSTEEAQMRRI